MLVAFLVALARGLGLIFFFGLVYTSLVRVYTRVFLSFGASVHLTSLISNPNDFPRVLITFFVLIVVSKFETLFDHNLDFFFFQAKYCASWAHILSLIFTAKIGENSNNMFTRHFSNFVLI